MFLTATKPQEKDRLGLAGSGQHDGDGTPHVWFPDAMSLLVDGPYLTTTDLRVLVRRYANQISDMERSWQIRHDAGLLVEALDDAWQRGTTPGIPADEHIGKDLAKLLVDLHRWIMSHPDRGTRLPLPKLLRTTIEAWDGLPNVVVMEGFTFLTPVQRHLVKTHMTRGQVHVVMRHRQHDALFKALEHTHRNWWPASTRRLETVPVSPAGMASLRRSFKLGVSAAPSPLASCRGYHHRHAEVDACLDRIEAHIASGGKADDIAIVTPMRGQYDQLLREQAELRDLPVQIGVPPQLLLLTPVGRFVLLLYQVWVDGELCLEPAQLAEIIGSGWLGEAAQASATTLRLLSDQWFDRCRTADEWRTSLGQLVRAPDDGSTERLPTSLVGRRSELPSLWAEAIGIVSGLAERLFGTGPRTIGGHVRLLLEQLETLSGSPDFSIEQQIIEEVRLSLEEAADSGGMELEAEEFGEVLVALSQRYREAEEADGVAEAAPEGQVWLTTPKGIDVVSRQLVLALGFDATQVPQRFTPGWPIPREDLGVHLDIQRYLFGTLLWSASQELHISYAENTNRGPVSASVYLDAVAPVQHTRAPTPSPPATPPPTTPDPGVWRRDEYLLPQVAVYGLCPYRYRAEMLDERAGVMSDEFHLRVIAEVALLETTFDNAASARPVDDMAGLRALLRECYVTARGALRDAFPGLSEASWRVITERTGENMTYLLDTRLSHVTDGPLSVEQAWSRADVLRDGDHRIRLKTTVKHMLQTPSGRYFLHEPLVLRHFSYPEKYTENVDLELVERQDASVFRTRGDALRFIADGERLLNRGNPSGDDVDRIRDLASQLILSIERKAFPKNPGDHCAHCPALTTCLGRESR
ncbi:hypothetical protein DVS28_a0351 [Euzebya pacifica]|uniref:PD-(D/E)XK nuclease superfamily protein n=1 Tax=Euzebya pacifica TaxID=1608957 RepID=A0A346XS61_9ACTN|nr:hypothetical protein [Euzebya pacifica]AXV05058.1 hypothetical protein DVS28_a0351 [Euzebya pacifica]